MKINGVKKVIFVAIFAMTIIAPFKTQASLKDAFSSFPKIVTNSASSTIVSFAKGLDRMSGFVNSSINEPVATFSQKSAASLASVSLPTPTQTASVFSAIADFFKNLFTVDTSTTTIRELPAQTPLVPKQTSSITKPSSSVATTSLNSSNNNSATPTIINNYISTPSQLVANQQVSATLQQQITDLANYVSTIPKIQPNPIRELIYITQTPEGKFDMLSSGTSTTGYLTFTDARGQNLMIDGNLTVSGSQNLSGALGASYFNATDANATSTFAGNVVANAFYGDGSKLTGISTGLATSSVRSLFSATSPLDYNQSTGVFSVASNYTIPLTASTTEWSNKISSQWSTNGSSIYYNLGNVGIGTTTPQAKFVVTGGDMVIDSTNKLYFGNGTSGGGYIYSSNAPFGPLTVGSTNGTLFNGKISSSDSWWQVIGNNGISFSTNNSSQGFRWQDNNSSNLMTLTPAGSLGIGTTSPAQKLDVNGNLHIGTGVNSTTGIYIDGFTVASSFPTISVNNSNSFILRRPGTGSGTSAVLQVQESNATAYLTVMQGGNVGIGTTTPSAKLEVSGNAGEEFRVSRLNGSSNAYLSFSVPSGSPLISTIQVAGGNNLSLTSTGNVGIGTTSPVSLLANNTLSITDSIGTGVNPSGISWGATGSGYVAAFNQGGSTPGGRNVLLLKTAATDTGAYILNAESNGVNRFTIRADGNVGIGTTSPSTILDVWQPNFSEAFRVSRNQTGYFSIYADGGTYGGTDLGNRGVRIMNIQKTSGLSDGGVAIGNAYTGGSVQVPTGGLIVSGNVGIGTTTPLSKLTVMGDIRLGNNGSSQGIVGTRSDGASAPILYVMDSASGNRLSNATIITSIGSNPIQLLPSSGGVNGLTIDSSGNVGMGTTSPQTGLDIASGSNINGQIRLGTLNQGGRITFRRGSDGIYSGSSIGYAGATESQNFQILASGGGSYLTFGTQATERVRIDTNGNVGIGTTTPAGILDVNGGDMYFGDSTNTGRSIFLSRNGVKVGGISTVNNVFSLFGGTGVASHFVVAPGGNVGIGTTTPAQKLDVLGNIQVEGTNANILLNPYGGASESSAVQIANARMQIGYDGATSGTGFIMTGGGRDFRILTNAGTEVSRFTSGGNVGIGTSSPMSKLSVSDTAGGTGGVSPLVISSNDTWGNGFRLMNTTNGADWQFYVGGSSNSVTGSKGFYLYDGAAGATRFSILNSNGNVGIGTNQAAQKLEVAGNTDGRHAMRLSNSNSGTSAYTEFQLTNNQVGTGFAGFYLNGSNRTADGGGNMFNFYNDLGGTQYRANGDYIWLTGAYPGSEKMRLTSAGNLGIGTTTPGEKLSVDGNALISGNVYLGGAATTSNNIRITGATGSLGIGQYGSNEANYRWGIGSGLVSNGIPSIGFNFNGNTTAPAQSGTAIGAIANKTLAFWTSNGTALTERMRIDGSGNVGIGTTSPDRNLTVFGNTGGVIANFNANGGTGLVDVVANSGGQSGLRLFNSTTGWTIGSDGADSNKLKITTGSTPNAGTAALTIDRSGNVGIGQTSPITLLTNSSSNINDFSGSRNVDTMGLVWKGGTATGKYIAGFENSTNSSGANGVVIRTANTTNGTYMLQLVAGGTETASFTGDGQAFKPGGGSFTATSDRRAKKDIQTLSSGLDAIMALNPVTYKYNGLYPTAPDNGKTYVGLIAQEVVGTPLEQYMISTDENSGLYRLDPSALSFALVGAVKELNLKIDSINGSATTTIPTQTSSLSFFAEILSGSYHWTTGKMVAATGFFNNVFAKKVTTQELCVGDQNDQVCVTKDQLKNLLTNQQTSANTEQPSPSASASPSVSPSASPSPSVTPEASPSPSVTLTPSVSPEPIQSVSVTPEVSPSPTPNQNQSSSDEPAQEPN